MFYNLTAIEDRTPEQVIEVNIHNLEQDRINCLRDAKQYTDRSSNCLQTAMAIQKQIDNHTEALKKLK